MVGTLLDDVGLTSASGRRISTLSLGMRQRLGIATALFGDPGTLVLDEPVNGLDPDGVRWVRTLLRRLASEGRTVLVSSHLMSEMQQTADSVVVIGRGRWPTSCAGPARASSLSGTGRCASPIFRPRGSGSSPSGAGSRS